MADFAATVKNWTERTKKAQEHIFKSAVQDLADEILLPKERGGRMPVDTGNLRRSLLASTSAMPPVRTWQVTFNEGEQQVALTIAGMNIKETLFLGFQAEYAMRMEYGFVGQDSLGRNYNQAGNSFVGSAVQNWQKIVDKAAKEYDK